MLCFIKKSQPKITGADRSSSIMKGWSTCRFLMQTDITDMPDEKMGFQTAPDTMTSTSLLQITERAGSSRV